MSLIMNILIVTVGFLIGILFFGFLFHKKKLASSFEKAQSESKIILEEARIKADQTIRSALKEAKEEAKRRRKLFEEDARKRKQEISKLEKKIKQRESNVSHKLSSLDQKEKKIQENEEKLSQEEKKLLRVIAEQELLFEKTVWQRNYDCEEGSGSQNQDEENRPHIL